MKKIYFDKKNRWLKSLKMHILFRFWIAFLVHTLFISQVPNDFLPDSCIVPVVEPNYSSLRSWLISLGLPMYESNFTSAGLRELHHISTLGIEDLAQLGIHNTYHQAYLESALTVLYMRFRRRPQTYAQGPSLS